MSGKNTLQLSQGRTTRQLTWPKVTRRKKPMISLGITWRINRQTTSNPHPCTLCTQNLWWRWWNWKIHHPKLYQTLQKELFSTQQMQKGSTITWVLKTNCRSTSCESSAESSREVKAELFVHNMLTANVMYFNNTINVLHDKRISFGDKTYKIITALALGFWNEGNPSPETKFGKLMKKKLNIWSLIFLQKL